MEKEILKNGVQNYEIPDQINSMGSFYTHYVSSWSCFMASHLSKRKITEAYKKIASVTFLKTQN